MYDVGLSVSLATFSYGLMALLSIVFAGLIAVMVKVLAKTQRKAVAPTPVMVAVTPARDESAEIAAAIGAAVFAVLGAHRLVYIGDTPRGPGWTSEIRSRLHTSHTPRNR